MKESGERKEGEMLNDILTYGLELMSILDVLKAVQPDALSEVDSLITIAETAYNIAEALYDCASDLKIQQIKVEIKNAK